MKFFRTVTVLFALTFCAPIYASTVNINTADIETLENELTGVGPTRAQAIVDYREKHGPFKSIDDLVNVEGIGHRTVESNRSNIMLKEN